MYQSHYFIIVVFTLLQEVHLILGVRVECRDSRIISMINFDLNLIMNAFFGNKIKDIVVIHPLKSKVW